MPAVENVGRAKTAAVVKSGQRHVHDGRAVVGRRGQPQLEDGPIAQDPDKVGRRQRQVERVVASCQLPLERVQRF